MTWKHLHKGGHLMLPFNPPHSLLPPLSPTTVSLFSPLPVLCSHHVPLPPLTSSACSLSMALGPSQLITSSLCPSDAYPSPILSFPTRSRLSNAGYVLVSSCPVLTPRACSFLHASCISRSPTLSHYHLESCHSCSFLSQIRLLSSFPH